MLTSIARTCYRRRWRILLACVGLVVALSALGSTAASDFRMDFSLPGTETEAATGLLERGGLGDRAGYTGQLVAHAPDGVMAPAAGADVERLVDRRTTGITPATFAATTRLNGQPRPVDSTHNTSQGRTRSDAGDHEPTHD